MEQFTPITNYETFAINKKGEVKDLRSGLLLPQHRSPEGYRRCNIRNPDGYNCFFVHRLVAIQFIPNDEGFNEVDHIDRNKDNNNVNNLRWANDIIQSNNRGNWGKYPKYITYEKVGKKSYASWRFSIRSKLYGNHSKRFRSDKHTIEDAIKYKEEYLSQFNLK